MQSVALYFKTDHVHGKMCAICILCYFLLPCVCILHSKTKQMFFHKYVQRIFPPGNHKRETLTTDNATPLLH